MLRLAAKFYGGFVYGLPVLFLDRALCWQPHKICKPRLHSSTGSKRALPSWSRAGWHCDFGRWYWDDFEYLNIPPYIRGWQALRCQVRTTLLWFVREKGASKLHPITAHRAIERHRANALDESKPLPLGWSRREFEEQEVQTQREYEGFTYAEGSSPRYYFVHDFSPDVKFWYPIPICGSQQEQSPIIDPDSLLFCRTQRAWLLLAQCIEPRDHGRLTRSLRDSRGVWVGALQLPAETQEHPYLLASKQNLTVELVSISEGYTFEGEPYAEFMMNEWILEERPKGPNGSKYEWHNVLWVEWEDGIAYRTALGRVMKSAWEALPDLEWFDLVLG